jgi:hypothetical protein
METSMRDNIYKKYMSLTVYRCASPGKAMATQNMGLKTFVEIYQGKFVSNHALLPLRSYFLQLLHSKSWQSKNTNAKTQHCSTALEWSGTYHLEGTIVCVSALHPRCNLLITFCSSNDIASLHRSVFVMKGGLYRRWWIRRLSFTRRWSPELTFPKATNPVILVWRPHAFVESIPKETFLAIATR